MAVTPRTPDEIRQALIGYLVSTGALFPIDEGDVVATILGGVAEEISALENKLLDFVNGHLLSVSNELLDDRVAQIPNVAPRRNQVPAKGGSVRLTRSTSTGVLSLQPGSIQIYNESRPDIIYVNRDTIVFLDGFTTVNGTFFISNVGGVLSNTPAGSVTSLYAAEGIESCFNTQPFTGGLDREVDSFLRQRAMAMIMSLAKSQASAIEALALNFTDSNGTGILHARAYEYADRRRGYTELVVSDGQGLPASTKPAVTTTGTVPVLDPGSRFTFWFDYPAATPPTLTVNSVSYTPPSDWWIPIDEKGVAWTQGPPPFDLPTEGSSPITWSIGGHKVYRGWIKEFQEVVNRTCAAAGTRVRVMPAEVQSVPIQANCIIASNRSTAEIFATVKAYIVEFFERLAPGQTAFMHKLHEWVARVPGVQNIIFYDSLGNPQADIYPGSPRKKLATNITQITLR